MKKVYFGHPVQPYDEKSNLVFLTLIRSFFPNQIVENSSSLTHQRGYSEHELFYSNGMRYFSRQILPYIDTGVFLPYPDGMHSDRQWLEASQISANAKPVYELNISIPIGNLPTTPPEEIFKIFNFSDDRRLSSKETKEHDAYYSNLKK